MHSDISFLELLFRLSLFSLLSYKLYSLARAYLVPFLISQIVEEKKEQSMLLDKEKLLVSTQHRVKGQIYNQKQMFTLLERNVQEWHKTNQDENIEFEKQNKQLVQRIQEKRDEQLKNITLMNNMSSCLPQALERATYNLEKQYQTSAGKKLLTNVIDQMGQPSVAPIKNR